MSENGESKLCPVMAVPCVGLDCEWYGRGCPAHPTIYESVADDPTQSEMPPNRVEIEVTVLNDTVLVRRATFRRGILHCKEFLSSTGGWIVAEPGGVYPAESKIEAKVYDSGGRRQ